MSTRAQAAYYANRGGYPYPSNDGVGGNLLASIFGQDKISGGVTTTPDGKFNYAPYQGSKGIFGGKSRRTAQDMNADFGKNTYLQYMVNRTNVKLQELVNNGQLSVAEANSKMQQAVAKINGEFGVQMENTRGGWQVKNTEAQAAGNLNVEKERSRGTVENTKESNRGTLRNTRQIGKNRVNEVTTTGDQDVRRANNTQQNAEFTKRGLFNSPQMLDRLSTEQLKTAPAIENFRGQAGLISANNERNYAGDDQIVESGRVGRIAQNLAPLVDAQNKLTTTAQTGSTVHFPSPATDTMNNMFPGSGSTTVTGAKENSTLQGGIKDKNGNLIGGEVVKRVVPGGVSTTLGKDDPAYTAAAAYQPTNSPLPAQPALTTTPQNSPVGNQQFKPQVIPQVNPFNLGNVGAQQPAPINPGITTNPGASDIFMGNDPKAQVFNLLNFLRNLSRNSGVNLPQQ